MRVKLQTPAGTELAPYNPMLPPSNISQIMLLANPTKVHTYIHTDGTYHLRTTHNSLSIVNVSYMNSNASSLSLVT